MSRVIHFHVNLAEPPWISGESLKDIQPCTDAGQFARLKDSRHSPGVICQCDGASHVEFLLPRVVFIDDDVIVVLKRATRDKPEAAAQSVELSEIDTRHEIKTTQRLTHCACGKCDMRLLHQERNKLLAHG